jgi:hypothetical protein
MSLQSEALASVTVPSAQRQDSPESQAQAQAQISSSYGPDNASRSNKQCNCFCHSRVSSMYQNSMHQAGNLNQRGEIF